MTDKIQSFNPTEKVSATHDFRTNKEEKGKETLLADLSENGELPKMVSITEKEYKTLKKWKPFDFLTLDLKESNLKKEVAHSVLKLTKAEQKKMSIRQEALKISKIEETRENSETYTQTQNKKNTPWVKISIFSIITLIVGVLIGAVSSQEKKVNKISSNTIIMEGMESWKTITDRYIPLSKSEIVWVCSSPQQYEKTLLKIKENVLTNNTTAILITQQLPVKTQIWLAQKYNILVINLDRGIGHNNWMVLDQQVLINGSSNILTEVITNKSDALKLRKYIADLLKKKHTIQRP